LLESLGNVSLLERPLNAVTLMSAIRSTMRARRRHYEVQDHLLDRETFAAQLEDQVREGTKQLEQANEQLRQQIVERRQVEAALQQAQKMEVIGQMTGSVAHDFNNLLTAVLGNLELATRRGKDDDIRRYLDGATQAAQRGAKITSQLLAFSRTQRLQTKPIDLNSIVTAMEDLLFRTIGATIRIDTILENRLWQATADASQIESVILNLAVNARDAMPDGGRLLALLSADDRSRLQPHLVPLELPVGKHLERPKKRIDAVYFLDSGFASVVAIQFKKDVEVGLIGREGMSGVSVVLGDNRSSHSTYIQAADEGHSIPARELRNAVQASESLRNLLLKYVQAFVSQTTQTAICNAQSKLDQRLARWLLMAHDRIGDDLLPLTHEFLSLMLAVRRPGVTEALAALKKLRLIEVVRVV
jgi:signal transduction histidine kinase